jgi:AcrR family transcriptional regulator
MRTSVSSDGRRNAQGVATRRRIVKVAEKLFAEHGVDAVSVRAVNAACGLGPAATHYHFGSKEQLVQAVILDHGETIRDGIMDRVNVLADRESPPSTRELVETLVLPYLDLIGREPVRGTRFVKVIAQLAATDNPLLAELSAPTYEALRAQVRRAFTDVDPAVVELRWNIAASAVLALLAAPQRRVPGDAIEGVTYADELISFAVGGVDGLRSTDGRVGPHMLTTTLAASVGELDAA